MTDNIKYEYDVAFSFLQQDESLAMSLHSELSKSVKSFIYSEEQKRLAGSDGEVIFNRVFGEEARIVVILFRENWGKTSWTRIEQTAIRNRAHEEGYDFTFFISLEDGISLPKWLPKTQIWFDFGRFKVTGAVAVIQSKIADSGGEVVVLTNADKVRLANDHIKRKAAREQLLRTNGYALYETEILTLLQEYQIEVDEILKATPDWHLKLEKAPIGTSIISYGHQIVITKNEQGYPSVLISLWKGIWPPNGSPPMFGNKPKDILHNNWGFDINEYDQHGWSVYDKRTNFTTTTQMVKTTMNKLMDLAAAYKLANIKP